MIQQNWMGRATLLHIKNVFVNAGSNHSKCRQLPKALCFGNHRKHWCLGSNSEDFYRRKSSRLVTGGVKSHTLSWTNNQSVISNNVTKKEKESCSFPRLILQRVSLSFLQPPPPPQPLQWSQHCLQCCWRFHLLQTGTEEGNGWRDIFIWK